MDEELLIALLIMWTTSTTAIITFLYMWFVNDLAAFHPHSIDVEHRHANFQVVDSTTFCKRDHAIKSISAFVAPPGATSTKHFTVLIVIISISGMMGCSRWYYLGGGSFLSALLTGLGFGSLLLVATFEMDAGTTVFLKDKLLVTGWLLRRMCAQQPQQYSQLPFGFEANDPGLLHFVRSSPDIYPLFEEDRFLQHSLHMKSRKIREYYPIMSLLHMIGAVSFVALIPLGIALDEHRDRTVAVITFACFVLFCFMGYLTGCYVAVMPFFQCWVLSWNPFLREPLFMLKLQRSLDKYLLHCKENAIRVRTQAKHLSSAATAPGGTSAHSSFENGEQIISCTESRDYDSLEDYDIFNESSIELHHSYVDLSTALGCECSCSSSSSGSANSSKNSSPRSVRRARKRRSAKHKAQHAQSQQEMDEMKADQCLNTMSLQLARRKPKVYLEIVGVVMVMSELLAMLTPVVGMGMHWVTALCDVPPVVALWGLFALLTRCAVTMGHECSVDDASVGSHCVLAHSFNFSMERSC